MAAVLTYSDYWLPPTSIPVSEFVNRINYPAANKTALSRTLSETLGFEGIRIDDRAQEAEHFSILLDRYFSATDTLPDDIGYIIYTRGISVATGDPWSKKDLPCVNVPYFLHNKYGLQAEIFNVEQECSGSIVAIKIGAALLAGQEAKKISRAVEQLFRDAGQAIDGRHDPGQ